jgi:hypothetical protein
MSTAIGTGMSAEGRQGALRIWLRLFVRISGGAVAIAVALGLMVVLAASAQAQPAPVDRADGGAMRPHVQASIRTHVQASIRTDVQKAIKAEGQARIGEVIPAGPSPRIPPPAALQLMLGTAVLSLGFRFLLSAGGSRLLAAAAQAGRRRRHLLTPQQESC